MKPRHILAAALSIPAMLGVASVAQIAMQPAKPAQMQPPAITVVDSSVEHQNTIKTFGPPHADQFRDATKMMSASVEWARSKGFRDWNDYVQRRAATKSGIAEREPIEGIDWYVIREGDEFAPVAPQLIGVGWLEPAEPELIIDERITRIDATEFLHYPIRGGGGHCCDDVRIVPREPVSVPEPSPLFLIAAGLLGIVIARRARK
jgi:hypothetical protein